MTHQQQAYFYDEDRYDIAVQDIRDAYHKLEEWLARIDDAPDLPTLAAAAASLALGTKGILEAER